MKKFPIGRNGYLLFEDCYGPEVVIVGTLTPGMPFYLFNISLSDGLVLIGAVDREMDVNHNGELKVIGVDIL